MNGAPRAGRLAAGAGGKRDPLHAVRGRRRHHLDRKSAPGGAARGRRGDHGVAGRMGEGEGGGGACRVKRDPAGPSCTSSAIPKALSALSARGRGPLRRLGEQSRIRPTMSPELPMDGIDRWRAQKHQVLSTCCSARSFGNQRRRTRALQSCRNRSILCASISQSVTAGAAIPHHPGRERRQPAGTDVHRSEDAWTERGWRRLQPKFQRRR